MFGASAWVKISASGLLPPKMDAESTAAASHLVTCLIERERKYRQLFTDGQAMHDTWRMNHYGAKADATKLARENIQHHFGLCPGIRAYTEAEEAEVLAGGDMLKMGTTTQAAQFGEATYPAMVVKDMPSPLDTAARDVVRGLVRGGVR